MSARRAQPKSGDPQAGFFRAELALSFTFADVAEYHFKSGNFEVAESTLKKAQIGLQTIQRYLKDPKHTQHLTKEERQETRNESERLRSRLKSLTTKNRPPKA